SNFGNEPDVARNVSSTRREAPHFPLLAKRLGILARPAGLACLAPDCIADCHLAPAAVDAISAEFLEPRFLRRRRTQEWRGTLAAGAPFRAYCRRQPDTRHRLGLGQNDHAPP